MKKIIFFTIFLIVTSINYSYSENKNTDDHKKFKPESATEMVNEILRDMQEEDERLSEQSLDGQLSEKEFELIREKLRSCAATKIKSEELKDIIISLDLELSTDGSITKIDVIDIINSNKILKNTDIQTITKRIRKIFFHPNCSPLPVPLKKYNAWKNIIIRFSTSDF